MRLKLSEIKTKSADILEEIGVEGAHLTSEEIKSYASDVIRIVDDCDLILNEVENGLAEISRQLTQKYNGN